MYKFGSRGVALRSLLVFWAFAGSASAASFDVNSTIDEPDAEHGDGVCASSSGVCTFRAAVEESNSSPGTDQIYLPSQAQPYTLTHTQPKRCSGGVPTPDRVGVNILDYTQIIGGGKEGTIIDGNDQSWLARVETYEAMVIDNANDRIVAHRLDGMNGGTFIGPGNGLDLIIRVWHSFRVPDMLLVSTFNNGVLKYSLDGTYLGVAIPPTVNGQPFVAYDFDQGWNSDEFLVANGLPGGGIMRFSDDFTYLGMLATGGGLVSVASTNFFGYGCNSADIMTLVAVANENRIARYDSSGNYVGDFATNIPFPRGIAFGDGMVYVTSESSNTVFRIGYDQTNYGPIVFNGSGGLSQPQFLDVGPNGDLYVHSNGTDEILRYDGKTGNFRGVFTGPANGIGTAGSFFFMKARANGPLVNISGVTLQNGRAGETGDGGGGLAVDSGAFVTLTDSSVHSCFGNVFGGGIQNYGQIWLSRVSVTENSTPIGTFGQTATGGGIFNAGQLFLDQCLIAGNFAGKGAGISTHGPRTDIVNTTISGNKSNGQGGGLRAAAGAGVNINFSTITDNSTNYENGGMNGSPPGQLPPYGGGIYVDQGDTPSNQAHVYIGNSIVAGNHNIETDAIPASDPNFSPDCYAPAFGTVHSYTENIFGALSASCSIVAQDTSSPPSPTDVLSGTVASPLDAGLLPLADYGGATQSHVLETGSPAIDFDGTTHSLELFQCKTYDQRSLNRPIDGNGDSVARCDLGATEGRSTTNDFDADGIEDSVDFQPNNYSYDFSDFGNTEGVIQDNGGQILTITDAENPNEGVTISSSANGSSEPAVIGVCEDGVTLAIFAGETHTVSCVEANAGPDQTVECTANGGANVTLVGSGEALSGEAVSYAWSAPGITLQNANQSTATGVFPLGTRTASLLVSRGSEQSIDTAEISVVDTAKPVLTVPADVFASSCTAVSLGQATATDACGGTVTITNNAPASFKAGVHTVTWTATDARGNQQTGTQRVSVGLGDNQACCPTGSNVIVGTAGNNLLTGTSGVDCILGKGGQDTIRGLGGNDIISGGDGDDILEGGDGNDVIAGDAGQDTLRGQNGTDSLLGSSGDDSCFGGELDDSIFGGSGQDKLYGENGNDSLFGQDGDDRLEGAGGNDLLNGGTFNDTCLGGTGTNTLMSCETVL